jgi:hypothetical protein
MIVDDNEPDGLTLSRLMRPFDILWDEQRAELDGGSGPPRNSPPTQ